MALTAEQVEIRRTGLGASEIAAVAGLSPFEAPLDVWLRKLGIVDLGTAAGPAAEVGSELEDGLARLFAIRTGLGPITLPHTTLRHPDRPWQLASPDVLVGDDPEHPLAAVELKVVGVHMAAHWEDGIPAYVRAQVAQQQEVMAHVPDWYVARLIGTDFAVFDVPRDPEAGATITQIGEDFWTQHVLAETPPPPAADESRLAYVKKLYARGGQSGSIREVAAEDVGHVADLLERYRAAKAELSRAEVVKGDLEAALCEIVGEDDGISGPFGKFTWKRIAGRVDYKAVAAYLAAELGWPKVPDEIAEDYRGEGYRRVHDSPPKARK